MRHWEILGRFVNAKSPDGWNFRNDNQELYPNAAVHESLELFCILLSVLSIREFCYRLCRSDNNLFETS